MVETEVTVGAVVSVVEDELSEVLVELSKESSEELSDDEEELSVLAVLLSSDDEHEETSNVMLTIRTNQEVRLFILFLYLGC